MSRLITFDRGHVRFNYRVVGIAFDGDRVLLHRWEKDDFWALPGGRGELLEPAQTTLAREMREELRVDIHVERLVWVVENFFEHDDHRYHELAFYFLMTFPADCYVYSKQEPFFSEDDGVTITFQWFGLDELADLQLYPTFLKAGLLSLPPSTQHIVHKDP